VILIEGPNKKPYATVLANGRIELDKTNPRARELLADRYPNLVATFDNQEEADSIIDEVIDLLKSKGGLVGRDAEVFTRLENVQRARIARRSAQ
jgi:hypothetical protein